MAKKKTEDASYLLEKTRLLLDSLGKKEKTLYDWQNGIDKRIKRLEEELSSRTDRVRKLVQVGADMTLGRDSIEISTRTIDDSWIWDMPDNGVYANAKWDEGKWDDRRGLPVVVVTHTY